MGYSGVFHLAYDIAHEPDQGVVVVTKQIGDITEIVNIFYGKDAYELLSKLTTIRRKGE